MNRTYAIVVAFALVATGCGRCTKAPTAEAPPPAAHDSPTVPTPATPEPASTAIDYELDAARSKLRLRRSTNGIEKPLSVPGLSGTATVDKGRLTRVTVKANMKTLTGDERADDLKEPTWLSVADFPEATFVSTLVDDQTTGEDSHQIAGIIELRGEVLDYGFPANVAIDDKEVQGSAEIYLDGRRFGVPQTEDTVYTVLADLVFVRKAP